MQTPDKAAFAALMAAIEGRPATGAAPSAAAETGPEDACWEDAWDADPAETAGAGPAEPA